VAPTRHPPRIAVVGSTNIDLVAYTSRVPDAGETIIGERFAMGFGGKGANQAVMARLLGAEVAMINCVGSDAYGRMTLDNFAAFGIDTSHVHTVEGASGVAPIWVESDGTNRIIVIPGANDALTPQQAIAAIEGLAPIDVVIGQFEFHQAVTAAAFAAARDAGANTILNPAPGAAIAPSLLAETEWLIPNQVELGQVTGTNVASDTDLLTAASQIGCRLLVTLGEDGAALVSDGAVYRYPAPTVTVIDTTGAGDAFVGSFAYGLAAGWDETQAVTLGVMCAADSVTRHGTQASFPRGARITELFTAALEAPSTQG
jgi:ribokinase